ncbi:MAG TPA: hypothetical protein VK904_00635 [Miltoncostaeaceae bacterium]|nr:hypothetical protein [Miltoncostaeaceae bacterium]
MPIFHARRSAIGHSREARLVRATAEYLAVSRSPLRLSSPALHDLAEAKAWERVCQAAGIDPPDRARREEHRC